MICWNEIEDWLVNWFVSGMNFCGMKAKKAMESIYWWNELLLRNETKGMKRRTKQQQLRGKLINKIKHFFLPLREKKCWLLLNGKGASHSITFFNHQSHSASFKLKTFNLILSFSPPWIVATSMTSTKPKMFIPIFVFRLLKKVSSIKGNLIPESFSLWLKSPNTIYRCQITTLGNFSLLVPCPSTDLYILCLTKNWFTSCAFPDFLCQTKILVNLIFVSAQSFLEWH